MPRFKDGRTYVDVTANKTLTAADQGIVQRVLGDYIITLPATAADLEFIIMNGGKPVTNGPVGSGSNASAGPAVSPQAADGITGNGFTPVINKDAINTKATSVVEDEITLAGSGAAGVGAWNVTKVKGVWAREA